jgi:cysteinyl-tRNA synthetase
MSLRYLGEQIDIHGGGQDLIFPHHENEIAQTEAATGLEPFSRIWLHHGLLRLPNSEEKMTRHLGGLIPIDDVIQRWGTDALRTFILFSHYRKPLTFTDEALDSAKSGADRLRTAARAAEDASTSGDAVDATPFRKQFIEAMDDDLNTAIALAALFDLAREINTARDEARPIANAQAAMLELADILGLKLEESDAAMGAAPFIELLINVRKELRDAKQFEQADNVRNGLEALGVILEDTAGGTAWRQE